ncbi:LAQU0S13e02058g1_1 [Lachancea quebecensis]|uniref:LAQU0S13e02058g1_1 n=1 Tax=Lachancea quebecensis TaxID=1654605 RepID=A0A0N7MM42_9SACH|nr:LAQU0S13e02058g1_1 [Lachancea quebecensis]
MASSVGGVLSGVNPFHYNASAPYTLFLIQACIILVLSNGIHAIMARMRQPKVISEVLTGVILGPTAFGQIPHYTETIFPKSSIPGLTLVANLGIILFMFFLGLEVDNGFIRQNGRTALSIGLATLAVPFGFGCLFALPLYNNYMKSDDTPEVKFTVFMVFIAVSFAVTAFPVLCRILAELRLVKERVGVIVLTAGTMNDVVGWTLLALCIILSNSQSDPVNVVYILLCTAGWILLYVFPLRYALKWCLVKTNELKREKPSSLSTLCILVLAFLSAYFTDIIGVHPIFGAFIAGLIVPREEGYVIKLAERMEDIPNLVMIPIYFTIAGLNVNLTLLNKGKDWGFAVASIAIAVATKALSGALLSKLHGLFWRESFAVGVLMSCKGIVEIVVLSTGLNAGIISEKVYAMFIFMALISTFITTPLTVWILPESYRDTVEDILSEQRAKEHKECEVEESAGAFSSPERWPVQRVVVVLNEAESLASTLSLLQCIINAHHNHFYTPSKECVTRIITKDEEAHTLCATPTIKHIENEADLVVKTLYLRQLTDRTTDVISTSSVENSKQLLASDSTLRTFKIFADLFSIRYDNETMFSNAREKVLNIASISFSTSDILLFPIKGNLDVKEPWLNDGLDVKTSEVMQRLGSQNELPDDFINKLATSVKTNVVLYFANQDQELASTQTKDSEQIILLLPSPMFASSDYLALFLTLIVYQGHRRNGKLAELFILCNQKNKDSRRILEQWLAVFKVSDAHLQEIDVAAGDLESDETDERLSLSETLTASPGLKTKLSNDGKSIVLMGDPDFYRKGKLSSNSLDLVPTASHFKTDLVICSHPPNPTCCEQK